MTTNPLLGVFKPPFMFSAPMGAVVDADGIVICNTATRAALRRKAKISETDNGCEAVNAIGHFCKRRWLILQRDFSEIEPHRLMAWILDSFRAELARLERKKNPLAVRRVPVLKAAIRRLEGKL